MLRRAERSPLSASGNTLSNAAQETIGLLFSNGTLLAHGQIGVHRDSQVLFCQSAFQLGGLQQELEPGVVPPQVEDFAFLLTELHEVPSRPFLHLVRDLLQKNILASP